MAIKRENENVMMYGTMRCSCSVRARVNHGSGRHMRDPSPLAIFGRNILSYGSVLLHNTLMRRF